MPPVAARIGVLTNLFLGAAFADAQFSKRERAYVNRLICDLLCTTEVPAEVAEHIDRFDPSLFSLEAAAQAFLKEPPMTQRRLLELVTYVTKAEGTQSPEGFEYIVRLGGLLGIEREDIADLERPKSRLRESFTNLARVDAPIRR
jgi:uncharacterized tellurite resistance protein B-like protein